MEAWAWGLLAMLLGMALTLFIAHREWRRAGDEQNRLIAMQADSVEAALRNQLQDAEMAMRAMQSLYLASHSVTDAEFRTAFDNLQIRARVPSLQGVSFAERVPGPDGDHYLVRLVQPEASSNARLMRFDIALQPASLAAAERSRDLDAAVISAPFRLRQAPDGSTERSGMAMRLPVYEKGIVPGSVDERRARNRGSLGASFMLPTLIGSVLSKVDGSVRALAVFDITDGVPVLLHRLGGPVPSGAVHARRDIRFGQRTWRVELAGVPINTALLPSWGVGLLSGTLSSLLLGALVWSMLGTRRRAIDLANKASARYRDSEARFRHLNELLPVLVLLVNRENGTIRYANQAARERLGIAKSGARFDLIATAELGAALQGVQRDQRWSGETQLTGHDGQFWASVVASTIVVDDQLKWLMVATDVSEQRKLTERLSYQAGHDALTRLPNRQSFEDGMKRALASGPLRTHCLLFIDLDQFKLINDTSGHIAGDQMLVQVSMEMRRQLREQDMLARLGGDEFGVLMHDIDPATASLIAERLRKAIDGQVFLWEGRSYITSASIGGVVFKGGSHTLNELMAQADTACYTAKDAGRNRVHFYDDGQSQALTRRSEMDWAHRIRWALDESRLRLFYQEVQPVDGRPGRRPGIEVLLRLSDEQGRIVLPGAFLPAAERYGLMPRIDRWVLETTLGHIDELHPSGKALGLCSINLSASSLQEEGFDDYLLEAIGRHGVDPRRLVFEITETVAVRDLMRAAGLVERLRQAGCRVALDDFGAGMSSFGYLKHLGVDTIKIDGAFVADIERETVSHSIVRAIAEIGHNHGLEVVAEWVSSPSQVDALARLGVDMVQGFGIHVPELVVFQR